MRAREEKWEPYSTLRRSRDCDVGVVHLKDPLGTQLALCGQGFSAGALDMNIKNSAVPTCVFCVVGAFSGLRYWKLQLEDSPMRQTIEDSLTGDDDAP